MSRAAAAGRPGRVHDEAAYVLHRHDWSESSLILEVFSRHHGRLALVAKGVKRPTSQFRPVLLPLQALRLGWSGDAEVRTLKSAQWQGGHVMPTGEALLSGYYLNELLLRLLARDDPHEAVFDHYAEAVQALVTGTWPQAAVLRAFELLLLRDLGLLPALDVEGTSLTPLEPQRCYRLTPEAGLYLNAHDHSPGLPGAWWQALQGWLDVPQPFAEIAHHCADDRGTLIQQLRPLLHYHSGVQSFQTRRFMLDVQRLLPPRS